MVRFLSSHYSTTTVKLKPLSSKTSTKETRKLSLDSTKIDHKPDTIRLIKSSWVKARTHSLTENTMKSNSVDQKVRRQTDTMLEYESDIIESEIVTYASEDEGFSTEDTIKNNYPLDAAELSSDRDNILEKMTMSLPLMENASNCFNVSGNNSSEIDESLNLVNSPPMKHESCISIDNQSFEVANKFKPTVQDNVLEPKLGTLNSNSSAAIVPEYMPGIKEKISEKRFENDEQDGIANTPGDNNMKSPKADNEFKSVNCKSVSNHDKLEDIPE